LEGDDKSRHSSKRKSEIAGKRVNRVYSLTKIYARHRCIGQQLRKMSTSSSSASGIMNAAVASKSAPPAKKAVAKKEAVVAPVVVAAPEAAAAAAPKKAAAKKAAAAPAAANVVVSSTPVEAAAAAPVVPATTLDEDLKAVTGNLNTLRETVSAMLSQVKKLEKRMHREIKDARKRKRRAPVLDENGAVKPRTPSIFERPTKITDELCVFLGKAKGTLLSRSEVTKEVNKYVKEKNLKHKHDIKPDAPLKKLLSIGDGEPLTYFNLQRYLNRHYVKEAPVASS